jgi:type I restriction enzyme, S subunit
MKWEKVKLETVAEIIAGQSPESKYYNQSGNGLPFFQGKADFGYEYPKVRYWCTEPTKKAQPLDILLSVRAPVGPTNICNVESCIGRGLAAIRTGEKLNHKYLYWWFKSYENKLASMGNGSTFSAITTKVVKDLEIPLPPLHIQEQIADTLDKADALRRKDQELLQKYDELAQAIFYDMFGDPVKNEKNWDMRPLDYFISKLTAGVSVNSTDEDSSIQKPSVLKTSCVYTGKFRPTETKVIKTDDLLRARINPRKDTIVISRMNTAELVGKSAYVDQDYNNIFLPDRLWMTEKTDNEHSVMWLSYVLSSKKFMENVSSISSGTSGSMKNISKSEFLKLRIIVPPASLQIKFEHLVSNINKILKHLTAIKKNSQMIFDTYSTQVFS